MSTRTPTPIGTARDASSAIDGPLLRFRIMAFATGVMLLTACTMLLIKTLLGGHSHLEPATGLVWMAHGYLYLVYLVTVVILGVKLRWSLPRMVLVLLAGTVPTMSFVAEHFVTRQVRAQQAAERPGAPAA